MTCRACDSAASAEALPAERGESPLRKLCHRRNPATRKASHVATSRHAVRRTMERSDPVNCANRRQVDISFTEASG